MTGWRALRCNARRLFGHTDGHFYRARCRASECKREGYVTFHVWNIQTGECVETEYVPMMPAAGATPQEHNDHGRIR